MQHTLYEFLLLNKQISLPGIGTICLRHEPSRLDISNRQIKSPSYHFAIESTNDRPSKKLFEWLSSTLGISEWDAIKSVNDFSIALKEKLSQNKEVYWQNVGTIKRDDKGGLTLDSTISLQSEQPVTAEKVIREKAEHIVLVGEREKTSIEMEEYFAEAPVKRNYAWLIAVILTVVAIMFIGLYFSEKGFSPNAAGNQSVIKTH